MEKKKASKLKLRSNNSNKTNRQLKRPYTISHYFSSNYENRTETNETNDEIEVILEETKTDEPKQIELKNKIKVDININDSNDFQSPKNEIKFESIFINKKNPNNKKVVKKNTQQSNNFNYNKSDVNNEHLELAIALSRSIQQFENPDLGESSNDIYPNTQERLTRTRKTLEQFGFKTNKPRIGGYEFEALIQKPRRNKNNLFGNLVPTLFKRTDEDRNRIISENISMILDEYTNDNKVQNIFYNEFSIIIKGDFLESCYSNKNTLFDKSKLLFEKNNTSIFYTSNLVAESTSKPGNLLKDWGKILGREVTPPKQVRLNKETVENNKDLSTVVIDTQENYNTTEIDASIPVVNFDLLKNNTLFEDNNSLHYTEDQILYKSNLCIDETEINLNQISENKKSDKMCNIDESDQSISLLTPEKNETKSSVDRKSLSDSYNQDYVQFRSKTPDLFSDIDETINLKLSISPQILINETVDLTQNHTDSKVLDLTQSSNDSVFSDKTEKLSIENDINNDSNDSFDLPYFNIGKNNFNRRSKSFQYENENKSDKSVRKSLSFLDYLDNKYDKKDDENIVENHNFLSVESKKKNSLSLLDISNVENINHPVKHSFSFCNISKKNNSIEIESESDDNFSQSSICIINDEELKYCSTYDINYIDNSEEDKSGPEEEINNLSLENKCPENIEEQCNNDYLVNQISFQDNYYMEREYFCERSDYIEKTEKIKDIILCDDSTNESIVNNEINKVPKDVETLPYLCNDQNKKTPISTKIINIHTPANEVVIKVQDVTPMPDYDSMDTPQRNKELNKFGVKCLKKRKAIEMLKFVYNKTHPMIENDSEIEKITKQFKKRRTISCNDVNEEIETNEEICCIVGDLIPKNDSENDIILERKQLVKISSCSVPFHIAWYNYVANNSEIRLKILRYEPLQFEEIYSEFKKMGFKYHSEDIIKFFDKRCITIRTNQNSHRNNKINNKKANSQK